MKVYNISFSSVLKNGKEVTSFPFLYPKFKKFKKLRRVTNLVENKIIFYNVNKKETVFTIIKEENKVLVNNSQNSFELIFFTKQDKVDFIKEIYGTRIS